MQAWPPMEANVWHSWFHLLLQITWLVITEVRNKSIGLVTERRQGILVLCAVTHIFAYWTMDIRGFYNPSQLFRHLVLSLYMYLTFGDHPHPLDYLCATFRFCHAPHCWASPRKKITHSPSVFESLGTVSFALELLSPNPYSPSFHCPIENIALDWMWNICNNITSDALQHNNKSPNLPAMLLVTTMCPCRRAIMCGRTHLVRDIGATVLSSIISRSTASSVSTIHARCERPALLTRISI